MIELASGEILSRALYVAAELGIADLLVTGPRTNSDLANVTGVHAPSLYRLLRTLASESVFVQEQDQTFRLAPLGATLCSDARGSVRSYVISKGRTAWRAIGELLYSVETGQPGFDRAYGMPIFEYLAQHPDASAMFSQAMTELNRAEAAAVAFAYDLSDVKTLVDLGGGLGNLIETVLNANQNLRGTLFELPYVVPAAVEKLRTAGLADRCDVVPGDFFQTVPPGGDVYVLSHVIHDWDEEHCLKLLRNCRTAMAPGARLLIVEIVLPGANEPSPGKLMDLGMLVGLGGRERTAAEYELLAAQACFRVARIVPTASPVSVIEIVPTPAAA
jgi:hypothetical protein